VADLKCLIVDDVELGRDKLRRYLADQPGVTIVGEAGSGVEAVTAIRDLAPDVVFLDVEMPEMDGFDVLAALAGEKLPAVVFVTAYEHYAVRAFDVHAVDYLLKPVEKERLVQALDRVRAEQAESDAAAEGEATIDGRLRNLLGELKPGANYPARLLIKDVGRTRVVAVKDIDWVEAAGNYVALHCGKETHIMRETMTDLERRLDPTRFARIHRSAIVSIEQIVELTPLFNGDQSVKIKTGAELTLSRTYRDKVLPLLGDKG
jgi:two-component system LytT family response regulator